jgi:hypothetical protein
MREGWKRRRRHVDARDYSIVRLKRTMTTENMDDCAGLLPVLLNARGAQPGEAVLVDGILPGEEFFHRQRIPAASLFQRKQAAAHGSDHLRFAADDPALRSRGRQIRDRERTPVGTDDVLGPWAKGLRHLQLTHSTDQLKGNYTCRRLKFA